MSVTDLADMRDGDGGAPMGWGRMARELDLDVHPGIGSIMGHGNAPDVPPGQDRKADD
jgi:hypothetical protein